MVMSVIGGMTKTMKSCTGVQKDGFIRYLDLTDADVDGLPDELLEFIDELDEVRFSRSVFMNAVKTSTLQKLSSHKPLRLKIQRYLGKGDFLEVEPLSSIKNLSFLTINFQRVNLSESVLRCLSRLTRLELRECSLREIPPFFASVMALLEEVDLRDNHLSELPETFSTLSKLKRLVMARQKDVDEILLENLHLPSCLQVLDVSGNEEINTNTCFISSSLPLLNSLSISCSGIRNSTSWQIVWRVPELAVLVGMLTSLTFLDMKRHCLYDLPHTWSNLHHLTCLDLSYNKFTSLPEVVMSLTQMRQLYISHNAITEIQDTISHLTHLRLLDVSYNCLRQLPFTLSFLTALEMMAIHN